MDTDLLRQAQMQTKHLIGSLELAHRQTVKSMEETIATLKDQHAYWVSKRQQYIQRSARTGDEICDIRSLTAVDRDPCLDRKLLDIETRKIDDLSDVHSYPARTQIRRRSTMRTQSTHPPGFGAQSPFGRTGSRMSRRK
ncbi:uncharacterized protein LOC128548494 [Mercenaria mercenaria]|uniref:uncharacterized protein LOC128548494 n=1 Tax=Mercenaria mercenaria TaxID=6596 RepID=UPI00234EEAC3|nr:uncharacterized protein LOC128548494 [Mercenaria mercenaria]